VPAHDPVDRTLLARIAANSRWANTDNRTAATAAARAAFLARFDREVDPLGTLPPDERRRRAENAKRAFYARMSLAGRRARIAAATKRGERGE
jgi:hypothetical protein